VGCVQRSHSCVLLPCHVLTLETMVKIGRHGNIKITDTPCPDSAGRFSQTWNIVQGSSTDGRESQSEPFNTSYLITRNNTSNDKYSPQSDSNSSYAPLYLASPSPDTSCKYSKSTVSLSLNVNLVDLHSQSSPDTLPYLEIPSIAREEKHPPYFAASSNLWRQRSQPHSKSSIFGSSNLKLTSLCVILSMLLLCKDCMGIICSDPPSFANRTTYRQVLTFVNEANLEGLTGQCLTMTGSLADDMCQNPTRNPTNRMDILSQTHTNFCGLPLSTILSEEDKFKVSCARENCTHVLSALQALDQELSEMFCQFEDVLERIDCNDTFSTLGNCHTCKVSQTTFHQTVV